VAIAAIVVTLIAGNAFFMMDFYAGEIPSGNGVTFDRMVGAAYRRIGNPFSFPRNVLFAWRHRSSAYQYDQLGSQLFNNVLIDLGGPGDDRFLAGGWAGREEAGALRFRWGMTGESNVVLPLRAPLTLNRESPDPNADFLLRLRAQPFRFPGSPAQTVSVLVNHEEVETLTLVPELAEYEVTVPARFWRRYLNGITFKYGYARSPGELGLSDDARPLAVLFDTVELIRLGQ
jgi:hypothetical protein